MRLCIQWPRFGPYHLARLRETHTVLAPRGVEVIGLETAGYDDLYEWRVEQDASSFRREQVFPNRTFESIPPATMHTGTLEALDRLDPDAVGIMSYGYPDARAALAWCRRRRKAAVLMTDTKADDAERVGWREEVKKLIVDQYDAALAAGTPHRDYLRELGFSSRRIELGYNVVDNEYFRTGADHARRNPDLFRDLPGLADDRPYFLASNRFIARKNLDRLLVTYGAYRDRAEASGLDPWRLLMVGDGRLRGDLERLVQDRQIEGVVFCGFRQVDELPAYYGRAGAFVHPALVDQWALVVNEALASGLPAIISTGAGSAHDLIEEGANGYRFVPHDTETLTDRLFRLAAPDTDRERMGQRSSEIIAEWPLARFAEGIWAAARAGQSVAQRRPSLAAQAILTGINRLTRSVRSFHSLEV
jgi:glycosyltransferase involved in cell wall biosynthesis